MLKAMIRSTTSSSVWNSNENDDDDSLPKPGALILSLLPARGVGPGTHLSKHDREHDALPPRKKGRLSFRQGSRSTALKHAYVMLALGIDNVGPCVNVNELHTMYGHSNEGLIRDTVAGMGVTLKEELEPCSSYSLASDLEKVILSSTTTR